MRALRESAGTVSLRPVFRSSRNATRGAPDSRKVHTSESVIEVVHLRNVLESAGIACEVRNDRLGGALGEIPFVECWPQLWVRNAGDVLRARGLIDEALAVINGSLTFIGQDRRTPELYEVLSSQSVEASIKPGFRSVKPDNDSSR